MRLFVTSSTHELEFKNNSQTFVLKTNIGTGGIYEHYTGAYEVTPLSTSITLLTNDKLMDDNVTVNAIPYSSVDNPQGGKTITIA